VIKGCCDFLQIKIEKASTELWFDATEFLFYGFLLLLGELFFLADGAPQHLNVLKNHTVNIEAHFDFNELYATDRAKQRSCLQALFVFGFARVGHSLSRCKMHRLFMCLADVSEYNVRF
jgi:hypothetical protein